jgi:hypothetical protein
MGFGNFRVLLGRGNKDKWRFLAEYGNIPEGPASRGVLGCPLIIRTCKQGGFDL